MKGELSNRSIPLVNLMVDTSQDKKESRELSDDEQELVDIMRSVTSEGQKQLPALSDPNQKQRGCWSSIVV